MAFEDFFEDYLEPEVGFVVAAMAAALSPRVRRVVRQGAIYGISGVLVASDSIAALARWVEQGIRHPPASTFIQDLVEEARSERAK